MNPVAKKKEKEEEGKKKAWKNTAYNWRPHGPEWTEVESSCSFESLLEALFRVKGISVHTPVIHLILL